MSDKLCAACCYWSANQIKPEEGYAGACECLNPTLAGLKTMATFGCNQFLGADSTEMNVPQHCPNGTMDAPNPNKIDGPCEVLIVTYWKDFPWLEYALRSISRHLTGFQGVTIAIPGKDSAVFEPFFEKFHGNAAFRMRVHYYDEVPGKGMVQHMVKMAEADLIVPRRQLTCDLLRRKVGHEKMQVRTAGKEGREVLLEMPREVHATLQALTSAHGRTETENELSLLCARLFEAGASQEETLHFLRQSKIGNAPPGLQSSPICQMVLSKVPPPTALDTKYVLHTDADGIFKMATTPEHYFWNDKPYYLIRSWASLGVHDSRHPISRAVSDCAQWKGPTDTQLGWDTEWYTMAMNTAVLPIDFYKPYREHIAMVHKRPFEDHMLAGRNEFPQTSMDWTAMGAWAHKFMHDRFTWFNVENPAENPYPVDRKKAYHSHSGFTNAIREEIEGFLK